MSTDRDADLIIIGGGCAGLSLASKLARLADRHRTVVIEPRESYHHDRTWCFWGKRDHEHAHLIVHRWFAWRFATSARSATQASMDGTSYQCLPSNHFYEYATGVIEQSDQVMLELGVTVNGIADCNTHVDVHTSNGTLRSRWVVDTRPPQTHADNRASMNQLFVGAEVQTSQDCFDPSVTGLMEDMSVDDLGFRFTYVLPFSKRRALVEETRFTDRVVPRARLANDLAATLNRFDAVGPVETLSTEQGCIPMTTSLRATRRGGRVVRAGTAGGAVRASSGYAFVRIQRWAEQCAHKMKLGGGPIGHTPDPLWREAVDRLFLQVIRSQPEIAPRLFMSMGQYLSAKTMVRFLSDDCRFSDFVRVANALPKAPFLRELTMSWRQDRVS